jgi:tRNA pseudouridine55 synthase
MRNFGLLSVYKKQGETPLRCLDRLRVERPEFASETLSYAGRLDPMASGLLLVLVGEEANRNRKEYLHLSKSYEVEVLFGFSTDTFDVLGKVTDSKEYDVKSIEQKVVEAIQNVSNFEKMEYPPYSSKPVEGKSLFQWAREGLINTISIPKQKGRIDSISHIDTTFKTPDVLKAEILNLISRVSGDFRQEEIVSGWNASFEKSESKEYLILKFNIECQSGTYMRSFADKLGKIVGVPAIAFSILRTRVGEYQLADI